MIQRKPSQAKKPSFQFQLHWPKMVQPKKQIHRSKAKKVHRKIKPNVIAVCCKDQTGKFYWLRYKCVLPASITSAQSIEFSQLDTRITLVTRFEDATKFIQQAGAIEMVDQATKELSVKPKIFKQLSMNIAKMRSLV